MEELEERLRHQKRIGTSQEDQQSQPTWTLEGSQRLIESLTKEGDPCTYVAYEQLGLHVGLPETGVGVVLGLLPACLWVLNP